MKWVVKKIVNHPIDGAANDNSAPFGFHDSKGRLYLMSYRNHWLGQYGDKGRLIWSAGNNPVEYSDFHIKMDLQNPHYITDTPDGKLLISSAGNKKIFKLDTNTRTCFELINGEKLGLTDVGNCVFDKDGNFWVNEIQGCRIWQFNPEGAPVIILGNGKPGFQVDACAFNDAGFNWIYDIRNGPDGNIYVLDSKNYAVRMIDVRGKIVTTIAGTGSGGYFGDGDIALRAAFGSNPDEKFDGPWAMSLDEEGNIYIGDTQNHVVRMIERKTNMITTIAGNPAVTPGVRNSSTIKDPFKLNLPKICSMDYCHGCLYVPEWDGDLVVLAKAGEARTNLF
jgi:hypothetical protein